MYASNGAALALVAPLASRAGRARPLLHGVAGALRRLSAGFFRADRRPGRVPDLGHPQGAHRKPRRQRAPALAPTRSTRPTGQLPLLRGRQRRAPPPTWPAVVAGVRFVRKLTAPLIASGLIAEELAPGAAVASDAQHRRLRARHRLGPPRVGLVRDRRRRRRRRRARQRLPRARHARPARRRRVGVPAHPRVLHRQRRLHRSPRRPPMRSCTTRARRRPERAPTTLFLTAGNRKE